MNNSEEKPKKTRQRKPKEETTITAFEAKKQEIKKVLKKKPQPLADDEEPIQFDLPKPVEPIKEPTTQQTQEPIKEPTKPIDIPILKITPQTPPTPQNSYKTPNKYYQYIY